MNWEAAQIACFDYSPADVERDEAGDTVNNYDGLGLERPVFQSNQPGSHWTEQ